MFEKNTNRTTYHKITWFQYFEEMEQALDAHSFSTA